MKKFAVSVLATLAIAAQPALVTRTLSKDIAPHIETIPIQTLTISDEQFLKRDASGRATTISGILRVAQGSGRFPLVILMHGSGGIEENAVVWKRLFASLGMSTFDIDSFTGRGIVSTVADQSQLGRLNMILDLYRSLAILAAHPRVDPNRIAVIGFSRGGQAALYATLKRFQKMWNASGIDPAASASNDVSSASLGGCGLLTAPLIQQAWSRQAPRLLVPQRARPHAEGNGR
jgi:poly(3-hydroxybutyrate) depolymerase